MKLFKSSRFKAVTNILFQTDFKGRKMGFLQSWNLLSNFPVLEKVRKKMVRSFFWKLQRLLYKYVCTHVCLQRIIDNALFLLFLRSLAHLFDNLESGKRNYCFGKSLEKTWILDPKICANPVKRDWVTNVIIEP